MKCPVHIGTVMRCPECFHWDAMKARAERAEAQLKAQAESGIWTTVEDLAALHQRLAEAEAQAAAMLVVEQDAEGRVSHIANADLAEKGRALLSRLRALEAVAEATEKIVGWWPLPIEERERLVAENKDSFQHYLTDVRVALAALKETK